MDTFTNNGQSIALLQNKSTLTLKGNMDTFTNNGQSIALLQNKFTLTFKVDETVNPSSAVKGS